MKNAKTIPLPYFNHDSDSDGRTPGAKKNGRANKWHALAVVIVKFDK